MQVNTKIQNPTNYFFNQVPKDAEDYTEKINEFTKKLINKHQCILCKQDFNFTQNIPRILIHCGHTFCTACLKNFHKNNRVRCPMCLKLVKQIETIERLPVNHTIFTQLAEEYNKNTKLSGEEIIDPQVVLFTQFEAISALSKKSQQQQQNNQDQQSQLIGPDGLPQKMALRIDEESGLEWCEYHYDRIKHFLCMSHKETCCRICCELFHNKSDCAIMDLYEIEDMHGFLNDFYKKSSFNDQNNSDQHEPHLHDNVKNFMPSDFTNGINFENILNTGIEQRHKMPDFSFKQGADDHDDEDDDDDDEDEEFEDDDEAEFEGDDDDDQEKEEQHGYYQQQNQANHRQKKSV